MAQRKIATIYQISATIFTSLEVIVASIRQLPNAGAMRLLRTNMDTVRGLARDSSKHCKDVENAFVAWYTTIGELRRAVLEKQNSLPSTSLDSHAPLPASFPTHSHHTRHTPPVHSLPPLPLPTPALSVLRDFGRQVADFWVFAPGIEACYRRFYKCLTSGHAGTTDWAFLCSPAGSQYLTALLSELEINYRGCTRNEIRPRFLRTFMGLMIGCSNVS